MAQFDMAGQLRLLHEGGTVVLPVRRARLLLALFGCAAFTAVGVAMIVVAVAAVPRVGPIALLSEAFIVGVPCVLVFGCWFMTSAVRQLVHPQRLVVRPDGFGFEVRHAGQWTVVGYQAWADVVEFFGRRVGGRWPFRGTLLCCYRLTPDAVARRPAPRSRFARWVRRANANLTGEDVAALPNTVDKAQTILDFLAAARAQQLGTASSDPGLPWGSYS